MAAQKKTIRVYTGENITFYPDSHRYKKEGESTYMISPSAAVGMLDKSIPLIIWNNGLIRSFFYRTFDKVKTYLGEEIFDALEVSFKEREKVMDEAASIGTMVHDYAQNFSHWKVFGGDAPVIPEDAPQQVLNGINAFLDWNNKHSVVYLDSEKLVYSHKFNYVGHLDALCMVDGKLTLVDYKTSKAVYSSQQYQVAAYKQALEEEMEFNKKLETIETYILDFNKEDGSLIEFQITQEDHEKNIPAFIGLLAVKIREKELSKWGDNK